MTNSMGKATWIYDRELDMHIPCCSELRGDGRVCGNGPLTGQQIETGQCGEDHAAPKPALR